MRPVQDCIYDHVCIEWDRVDESRGIPDGLRNDAKYIAAQVLEKKELFPYLKNFIIRIDTTKLNLTFSELTCKVLDYSGHASQAEIRLADKYSEKCELKLYVVQKDFCFAKLIPLIGHELQHWFTYVLNGEESSKSVYNEDNSGHPNEELIKQVLYYTSPDELNAFATELTLSVEEERPSSVKEACDALRKSDIYVGYAALYNKLAGASEDDLPEIFDIYRKINSADEMLTNGKIFRKLKRRLESARDRLEKIIPRILLDIKSTTAKR